MSTPSLDAALARALAAIPEVRLAYLFGSRARGGARAESDFDVAVLLDEAAVADSDARKGAIWRLAARLGCAVRSDRLDLVILNHAPVLLRHRVLRDGVLLHARSEAERVRFAIRTIREYQDFEPRLRMHTRRRIARLREGAADGGCGDVLEAARGAGQLLTPGATPR